MNKLVLGSAQFGLNYGIANKNGKISHTDIKKILKLAKKSKIDTIDTAVSYGASEKLIGDSQVKGFKFVTKLPKLTNKCLDINLWVEKNIQLSLRRLQTTSLYAVLIHHSEDLANNYGKKLVNALLEMKDKGLVKKIGVSIYNPHECELFLKFPELELIQSPLSIIDRRLIESGWLSRLHSDGKEIHVRSIFLQGLLLLPQNKIPTRFNKWSGIWNKWFKVLRRNNITAIEACLMYLITLPKISKVVVGIDNINQLSEIITKSSSEPNNIDWSFMVSNDQMLINPTNW